MSSTYCVQADMELLFGTTSLSTWADLEGDGTKTAARIIEAIAMAGEEIDAVLRTTGYSNRLAIADASAATPRLIKNIAAARDVDMTHLGRRLLELADEGWSVRAMTLKAFVSRLGVLGALLRRA